MDQLHLVDQLGLVDQSYLMGQLDLVDQSYLVDQLGLVDLPLSSLVQYDLVGQLDLDTLEAQ